MIFRQLHEMYFSLIHRLFVEKHYLWDIIIQVKVHFFKDVRYSDGNCLEVNEYVVENGAHDRRSRPKATRSEFSS
jgi:hypothetical protein